MNIKSASLDRADSVCILPWVEEAAMLSVSGDAHH